MTYLGNKSHRETYLLPHILTAFGGQNIALHQKAFAVGTLRRRGVKLPVQGGKRVTEYFENTLDLDVKILKAISNIQEVA